MSWLTYLQPLLANAWHMSIVIGLAGVGERSLMVWLLAKGVNVQRWEEKAGRFSSSRHTL